MLKHALGIVSVALLVMLVACEEQTQYVSLLKPYADDRTPSNQTVSNAATTQMQVTSSAEWALLIRETASAAEHGWPAPVPDERAFIVYAVRWLYSNWPEAKDLYGIDRNMQLASGLYDRAIGMRDSDNERITDSIYRLLDDHKQLLLSEHAYLDASQADAKATGMMTVIGIGVAAASSSNPVTAIGAIVFSLILEFIESVAVDNRDETRIAELKEEYARFAEDLQSEMKHLEASIRTLRLETGSVDSIPHVDPFAIFSEASAELEKKVPSSQVLALAAEKCLYATALIPGEPEYDTWRSIMLHSACDLSRSATFKHWRESGYQYGGSIASRSISMARSWLVFKEDPRGDIRTSLATCISMAGDHAEALRIATQLADDPNVGKIIRADDTFVYNFACLCSLNGHFENAIAWLRSALAMGYNDVQWCYEDPELAGVRDALPQSFEELMSIRHNEAVSTWVLANADYVFTNESTFTLTNVKITVTVAMNNGDVHAAEVSTDWILPGDTKTWRSVFPIIGQKQIAAVQSKVTCDQGQVD